MNRIAIRLLALTIPSILAAQTAVQASATSSATSVEQLADLIVAERQVVDTATANFDYSFDETVKAKVAAGAPSPDPSFLSALRTAGRSETIAILREGYPDLRRMITAKLSTALTPTEIAAATTFYASPTGHKISVGAIAGARGSTASAISTGMIAGAIAAVDASDTPTLSAFGKTSVFSKLQVLGPQLQQTSIDWATKLMAANSARLQRTVQETARAYLAAHPKSPR